MQARFCLLAIALMISISIVAQKSFYREGVAYFKAEKNTQKLLNFLIRKKEICKKMIY
jgi:hypothetical protein